jgi:hypothetical protein
MSFLRELATVWALVGVLIFWCVIMMPIAIGKHIYWYIKTNGKMIEKLKLTKQERQLLR